MRILELSAVYTPDPGGVATHISNLVHGLVALDHDVYVNVVTLNKDETQRRDGHGRLQVFKRPRQEAPAFDGRRVFGGHIMEFLLDQWHDLRPELIHAHDLDALFLSWQLKAIFNVPLVFTVHRAPSAWRENKYCENVKDCFMETIRRARVIDLMLVPSEASRDVLEKQGFHPTVVPHGITDFLAGVADDAEVVSGLAAVSDRRLVLCPSRSDAHKDPETFLEAAAILKRESPDLKVAFVFALQDADGGDAKLRNRARDLELADELDVLFRRYLYKQMATVFRRASLTVVPSRRESFGLTVLESFLFSVPVIAADTSALREIVNSYDNGLLFTDGDAPDLAAQMRRVLTNPSLAASLAAKGRHTLADGERYSAKRMVQRHQRLYQGLLGQ